MSPDEVVEKVLPSNDIYCNTVDGAVVICQQRLREAIISGVLVPREEERWECPHCGHDKSWFDRSIEVDADGNEIGMGYRCEKCGRRDDEESTTKRPLSVERILDIMQRVQCKDYDLQLEYARAICAEINEGEA